MFTPYTAVGSHEDIHTLSSQVSVQEILTSFEEKKLLKPPIPKPRRKSEDGIDEKPAVVKPDTPPKPAIKPKPSPRPCVKPTKSQDTQCKENGAPFKENGDTGGVPTKQKSLDLPIVPPKPKPKPTASPLQSPRPTAQVNDKPTVAREESNPTVITIEYSVNGSAPTHPSDKQGERQEKKRTGVKQRSTKSVSDLAYSVVDIAEAAPPGVESKSEGEQVDYDEVTEEYLTPVDAMDVNKCPAVLPEVTITPGSARPKTPTHKEKRNNFKHKKHMSKSLAEKRKPNNLVEDRRVSLPDFHPLNAPIYADVDSNGRPVSDGDKHIYLSADSVASPAVSDEEGWNTDEFDSSSGDEEEEEEEPIPKLVSSYMKLVQLGV